MHFTEQMYSLVGRISSSVSRKWISNLTIDPIQAKYLEEPCIRVNQLDEPLGPVSKKDCHMAPILHRAFSVFVFDSYNKLLLQKRSSTKITFPDVWTNACCSHPHYSETELTGDPGIKLAARRKLQHELGVDIDIGQMLVMGRFIYKANSDGTWVEHELDYAICIPNFNYPIKPNPEEVKEVKFVSQQALDDMFAAKVKFSPWFTLFSTFQWLNLWWQNLDRLNTLKDVTNIHQLN